MRDTAVKLVVATPDTLDRSRDVCAVLEIAPALRREAKEAADQREREFLKEIWTLP